MPNDDVLNISTKFASLFEIPLSSKSGTAGSRPIHQYIL